MASVKPVVEETLILSLLGEIFDRPIQELTQIQSGLIAQTLSFRVDDEAYILRFTMSHMESFQKEAFICKNFASPAIPIPPILKVGRVRDMHYAISKKMPGRELQALSRDEYQETLPSIIQTLYAIHQADVSAWSGYGWLDDNGRGSISSWQDFIGGVKEEQGPDTFFGKWHALFQTTFLDRDYFEAVYSHMMGLLQFCPEERYLVHGDYGYNNVLAEADKVTAVLDWSDTIYGDFVYDIAYIGFWRPGSDLIEQFHQYYASQGMPLSHFWERVACYKCYMGLDAMRFYAKTNDREAYQATCQILQNLLSK